VDTTPDDPGSMRETVGAGRAAGPAPATPVAGAGPAAIRLEHVRKVYPGDSIAVADLSLTIPEGELVALVGPSGCGKSTLLRMMNRLIEPTAGQVWLGEEAATTVDPVLLRRRIGYVIQHVGLFPHQSVQANIATVPRLLGRDARTVTARTDEMLRLVGLDPHLFRRRYPHELSGGQRQRVGVARALAGDPAFLLMDEPFSALDPLARNKLQDEFRTLQQRLGTTVVLVTHDIDEAVKLADRIAVLSESGHLEQYADPATLLAAPANDFVAWFVGGDRSLRLLSVVPLDPTTVVPFEAVGASPPASTASVTSVEVGATLKDALVAILAAETPWVAVRSGESWLGALTVEEIHATLRQHTRSASPQ
jgi:osmoprotectant transport system ATP-binding protein